MANSTDNQQTLASGIAAFEAKYFNDAYSLLTPLAEEGNAEAMYRLAIMCQNGLGMVTNEILALRYMKAAAEQEHAMAAHGLGVMYMFGECTQKDGEQAVKWFERAAKHGLVGALTSLGVMYKEGTGVEPDETKAREYFKQAGYDADEFFR